MFRRWLNDLRRWVGSSGRIRTSLQQLTWCTPDARCSLSWDFSLSGVHQRHLAQAVLCTVASLSAVGLAQAAEHLRLEVPDDVLLSVSEEPARCGELGAGWYVAPAAASLADIVTTELALRDPKNREGNLFTTNRPALYASKVVYVGGSLLLVRHFDRQGHHKLAKGISLAAVFFPALFAVNNVAHMAH